LTNLIAVSAGLDLVYVTNEAPRPLESGFEVAIISGMKVPRLIAFHAACLLALTTQVFARDHNPVVGGYDQASDKTTLGVESIFHDQGAAFLENENYRIYWGYDATLSYPGQTYSWQDTIKFVLFRSVSQTGGDDPDVHAAQFATGTLLTFYVDDDAFAIDVTYDSDYSQKQNFFTSSSTSREYLTGDMPVYRMLELSKGTNVQYAVTDSDGLNVDSREILPKYLANLKNLAAYIPQDFQDQIVRYQKPLQPGEARLFTETDDLTGKITYSNYFGVSKDRSIATVAEITKPGGGDSDVLLEEIRSGDDKQWDGDQMYVKCGDNLHTYDVNDYNATVLGASVEIGEIKFTLDDFKALVAEGQPWIVRVGDSADDEVKLDDTAFQIVNDALQQVNGNPPPAK